MTRPISAQGALLDAALAGGEQHRRALEENRRKHGLEPVPTFLVPVLLHDDMWPPLAHAVEALHRALVRLQQAYFDGGRFRDVLSLPAGVEALTVPPPVGAAAFSCRFDVALDPTILVDSTALEMKVLEVQVGDPSGAGWTDLLWDGLAPRFSSTTGLSLRSPSLVDAHRRAALDALAAFTEAAPADPLVAFACARDSFVRSDHDAMATLYRRFGTRAIVVDPRDIEVGDDGLSASGGRVDLLIRDTVDEYVLAPFSEATEQLRAHLGRGRTLVLPSFRDALLDDKRALALLSAGDVDELLPDDEDARAAVRRHVPWTRSLDADTLASARGDRRRLVVKPADGYGGHGVVVGDAVSDASWQAALDDALTRPSILQERQALPRLRLPLLERAGHDEDADEDRRFLCVSLWCHGGRFSGGYARASHDVVVNVHRGGGIVPLAFVR